jgi:chorismate mutase
MSGLDELREQIDALDEDLLKVLARRMDIVAEIGAYKKANGLELRDDKRFQALVATQRERAEALNLPEELVAQLCELIHTFALKREAEA